MTVPAATAPDLSILDVWEAASAKNIGSSMYRALGFIMFADAYGKTGQIHFCTDQRCMQYMLLGHAILWYNLHHLLGNHGLATYTSSCCCHLLCQSLTQLAGLCKPALDMRNIALTYITLLDHRLEAVMVASQRYANRTTPLPPQATADPYSSAQRHPFAPVQGPSSSTQSFTGSSSGAQPSSAVTQSSADPAALISAPVGSPTGRSSLRWHPHVQVRQYSSPGNSSSAHSRLGNPAMSGLQPPPQAVSSFQAPGSNDESPMASSPSGYWGRSSLGVPPETASAGAGQDVLVVSAGSWDNNSRQKVDIGAAAAGRSTMLSLLDSPSSFSSSFSSPYGMKASSVASSQSRSKPGSPTKRSQATRSEQPLRTSSKSMPGNASLDAGSWIYVMGSRSSSIAAKQMAKINRDTQNDRLQL